MGDEKNESDMRNNDRSTLLSIYLLIPLMVGVLIFGILVVIDIEILMYIGLVVILLGPAVFTVQKKSKMILRMWISDDEITFRWGYEVQKVPLTSISYIKIQEVKTLIGMRSVIVIETGVKKIRSSPLPDDLIDWFEDEASARNIQLRKDL